MVARVIAELILAGALIAAVGYAAFRYSAARTAFDPPRTPADAEVSRVASSWFTDTRTTDDGRTEVCIVRVEDESKLVRERRILRRLDTSAEDYADALDKAMNEADEAMRTANANLRR